MHRTDGLNSVAGAYVDPNPTSGTPGTQITAAAMNAIQEELCLLIEAMGITLAKGTNNQLLSKCVSAATASAIMRRDENGRAKVSDGSAPDDIATKGQVDAATTASTGSVTPGTGWSAGTNHLMKVGKVVTVRFGAAAVTAGATWSWLCTLPAGFRPAYSNLNGFNVAAWTRRVSSGFGARVLIDRDGVCSMVAEYSGTNGAVNNSPAGPTIDTVINDGISFEATFLTD